MAISFSKKWVAAAAAAMVFAGCREDESSPVVKPVIASKRVAPVISPPLMQLIRDAGTGGGSVSIAPVAEATPVDALALSHEAPSVDHLARARKLDLDGDARGALVEARRAIFSAPNDEEAVELVAKLARRVGQPTISAMAWQRLATFRPTDATPAIEQARASLQAKDYAGMSAAAREAIARDDGNAEGYHLLGLGQLSRGELAGAISNFERAVEIAPHHGYALNNLGLSYLRANENQKAVEVLEKASEILPNIAYVQNNYGVALERVGRKDEAVGAYNQAMGLSPKYVKARVNAARVAKVTEVEFEDEEIEIDPPHPMSGEETH